MALKLLYEGGPFLFGATTGKLSCECCCYPTCPTPTIQWKSRSASKTKCGFTLATLYGCPTVYFLSWNSVLNDSPPCGSTVVTCSDTVTTITNLGSGPVGTVTYDSVACSQIGSFSGSETCRDWTFSSPYTTATLKSNTTAALSSYTGTWTGTAGSYFNLTTDELTNSIRQAKYRFQFTVPETCGAAMCYKIEWTEGSTPMSYTYTGTDPAGTTLYTGEYEIPIPATNSTVTVTGITSTCTGC